VTAAEKQEQDTNNNNKTASDKKVDREAILFQRMMGGKASLLGKSISKPASNTPFFF